MKVVWKATNPLVNNQSVKTQSKAFELMQQLHEWDWLDKKLSKHFEKNNTELNNT